MNTQSTDREVTHTPGPWKQCPGPDYADENYKRSNQLFIQTAGGSVVAEARRMATFGKVQDIDLANARLIAAAPDLLHACELIVSNAPRVAEWLKENDPGAYQQVCAAVAKAKGAR